MEISSSSSSSSSATPSRCLHVILRDQIVAKLRKDSYIANWFQDTLTKGHEERYRRARDLLSRCRDWRDDLNKYTQEHHDLRAVWLAAAAAAAGTSTSASNNAPPLARHIWRPDGSLVDSVDEQSWIEAIDQRCAEPSDLEAQAAAARTATKTDDATLRKHADLLLKLWPLAFPVASPCLDVTPFLDHPDDVVRSDFSLPMYGSVVTWLQKYVCNANDYHRNNPSTIYSKAFPILQSSGTGKTKLAVQLSAEQAGFLVCTRSSQHKGKTSFPPNDALVYNFLSQVKASNNHTYASHRRVACWLGAYFGVLAYSLEKRMVLSGCFGEFDSDAKPQKPRASDLDLPSYNSEISIRPTGCLHTNPEVCWRTVVYQLAKAIHNGPDFIENYSFNVPNPPQCRWSRLSHVSPTAADTSFVQDTSPTNTAQELSGPSVAADTDQTQSVPSASTPQSKVDPTHFRTHLLTSIDDLAQQLLKRTDPTPSVPAPGEPSLTKEVLANHAANLYMRPFLKRLESLLPEELVRSHFFFLVIDEIMPLSPILPILRRLWREAEPQSTWLMFIDTDSKIAPLAGIQVRLDSARLEMSENLLVIPPFVDLGFDAVIQHKSHTLSADVRQGRLTFSRLLSTLGYFGRPLWNTNFYRSVDESKRPHLEKILIKLLTYQQWPNMWPTSTKIASLTDPNSAVFQSIMAIAGQRLPLNFVGHTGVNLGESSSAVKPVATATLQSKSMTFLQELASKHLRVVSKVHDNVNFFITSSVSEPALSLAVASLLRGRTSSAEDDCKARWSTIVEVLCHAHRVVGLMLGEEGEEGVRLLLSFAADLVASSRVKQEFDLWNSTATKLTDSDRATRLFGAHCDPICLRDWLKALFGAENLDPWLLEWARQYYLNFTHFMKLGSYVYSDPTRKHKRLDWLALAEHWWRQVAVYGQPNQPGWDIVFPIYRSDRQPDGDDLFKPENVSYVAIQIKNRKSDVTASRFFGPSLRQDDLYDLSSFHHGCLEIFIDLRSPVVLPHRFEKLKPIESRNELDKPPGTRYHLTISGFGPKVYPPIERLTSNAQTLLPLMLGHTENEMIANAERLQLSEHLFSGLPDIELSKSILDGHGPAHFWKPDQTQAQQRCATRFDWKKADTDQETVPDDQDVLMAEAQEHIVRTAPSKRKSSSRFASE